MKKKDFLLIINSLKRRRGIRAQKLLYLYLYLNPNSVADFLTADKNQQ